MSWEDIVKYGEGYIPQSASDEETRLQMEFQDDDRRESAMINLRDELALAMKPLRILSTASQDESLDELYDTLSDMKTQKIDELADKLGVVSLLLNKVKGKTILGGKIGNRPR